jgi:Acetyltransferase (GNAT) family.
VKINYTDTITAEDYNKLRVSAGWREMNVDQASAGLKNSAFIVSAKDGELTVGMARLITDGGHSYFIEDVVVLSEYQRKGIGTAMMNIILERIKIGLRPGFWFQVALISAKGKEPFYKKFGFVERPNETGGAGMNLIITN